MAKVVEGDLPLDGRASKYPWEQWFDGRTWELTKGEDYNVQNENMRSATYIAAKRSGKRVSISVVDETTIRLQARPR